MKLSRFMLAPVAGAMILSGCVTAPATQLSTLTQQHSGGIADLNAYGGKVHVFFTVQDKAITIDGLKTKIERSDVEALYLPNANNEKQGIRTECMTIHAKTTRYEPCYVTLGLHNLREKSIFIKGNVSAGGVLTSIIAVPFAVAGAAINIATLNGKGAVKSVKGLGKGTINYSTDEQAVQQIGRYVDDRLAQAQKNARQALATYNLDSVQQAKNLNGLLKDDEFYQAYVKAQNANQRVAVLHILGLINGQSQKFDHFNRLVLKSPKDLPFWAETLNLTAYKPRLSLEEAKRIPNFASSENMKNFFNSNEYRYVLQYLKPEKITTFASGEQAGINVSYGQGVQVSLSRHATCQKTNSYENTRVQQAAWWAIFGSDYSVREEITEYNCQISSQDVAQLQAWEKQLIGTVNVTNNLQTSWKSKGTRTLSKDRIAYETSSSSAARFGNTSYEVKRQKERGGWGYTGYEYDIYCNSTGWATVTQLDVKKNEYSAVGGKGGKYSTLDQAARAACNMN